MTATTTTTTMLIVKLMVTSFISFFYKCIEIGFHSHLAFEPPFNQYRLSHQMWEKSEITLGRANSSINAKHFRFFFRALNLYFAVDIWNCSMNVEVNRHEFVPFLDFVSTKNRKSMLLLSRRSDSWNNEKKIHYIWSISQLNQIH